MRRKFSTADGPPERAPDPASEVAGLRPEIERFVAKAHHYANGGGEAIEDKVQRVMVRALGGIPRLQPHRDGLKPWLTTIARNVTADAGRAARRRGALFSFDEGQVENAAAAEPSPEDAAALREACQRVARALATMPPGQRVVLCMSALDGLSHAEIGVELGISEDASKMKYKRARHYLAEKVGDLMGELRSFAPLLPPGDEGGAKLLSRWPKLHEVVYQGGLLWSAIGLVRHAFG